MNEEPAPTLTAYILNSLPRCSIVPAARKRDWMDQTNDGFANRCLPMLIANQAGWWLVLHDEFTIRWNGGRDREDIEVRYTSNDTGPFIAISHFGAGILTFRLPYLFRTSDGWLLRASAPVNYPRHGVTGLEGIIETDWANQAFTYNYAVTAVDEVITFRSGEPFCQLQPLRRGDFERFEPIVRPLTSDPEINAQYRQFHDSRQRFNDQLHVPTSQAVRDGWQRHYVRGEQANGEKAPARSHQTALKIRPFRFEN